MQFSVRRLKYIMHDCGHGTQLRECDIKYTGCVIFLGPISWHLLNYSKHFYLRMPNVTLAEWAINMGHPVHLMPIIFIFTYIVN